MTAVAERARLGAIGTDLIGVDGGPAERRVARFVASLSGNPITITDFCDLGTTPVWRRWPRAAQRRLAQRVALASIADAVAGSIDGEWLGALADVAGEDALDWAASQAERVVAGDMTTLAPKDLEARGFSLLASTRSDDRTAKWIAAAMKVGA